MPRGVDDPYLDEIVRILQPYEPERPFIERLRDMVPYLVQFDHPADILVYTPEEFEQMGETGLGWLVRQEGVTLYERPASRG